MLVIRCIRLLGGLPWGASWCSISRCKAALILSASLTICVTEGIGWDKILWISSRDFRASITSERSASCKTKMSLNWNYKNNKNPLFASSHLFKTIYLVIFNNYSPQAKWILLNNPRDEVEGIIRQYSLSLKGIIVLVEFQSWTTENNRLKH